MWRFILPLALLLTGCGQTGIVLKHPETGKTVGCNEWYWWTFNDSAKRTAENKVAWCAWKWEWHEGYEKVSKYPPE